MKYTERRALRVFEEDHLRIDDTFRARLRKQLVHGSQPAEPKRLWTLGVPLVLSSVVIGIVIAGVAVWNLDGGHAPRVSAMHAMKLVSEVNRQYQEFDPTAYSFVSHEMQRTAGPAANRCRPGVTDKHELFFKEASESYAYRAPDGSTEARYWRISSRINTQEESYYGPARNPADHPMEKIAMPLTQATYRIDGVTKPTYFIVDRKGSRLPSYDIPKQRREGQDVYAFYFRYDPLVMGAQCKGEIISFVVDAQTYAILENDTYINEVAPGNLVVKNHAKVSYSNLDKAQALSIMEAAGFNMDEAIKNGRTNTHE